MPAFETGKKQTDPVRMRLRYPFLAQETHVSRCGSVSRRLQRRAPSCDAFREIVFLASFSAQVGVCHADVADG